MSKRKQPSGDSAKAVTDFFKGERLELNWRYAYRPEFMPLLLDYLGAQPDTCILDVGCGSGFLTRLLAQSLNDARITGLDADKKMLDTARHIIERETPASAIKFRQGNTYHLPFPDNTFDLVTSHTLL